MIDMVQLEQFLRVAKAATYAGGGPKAAAARPNSDDYHYEDGVWVYHDCYWGAGSFIGHEIVWYDGTPVWGLNYYGGPTSPDVDTTAAYGFLKHALLALDSSVPPLRGPQAFQQGSYTYQNQITGTVAAFQGIEDISLGDTVICRHIYHGGLIT